MISWFFDTAGIGSLVVFAVAISVFIAYFNMVRWIQKTPPPPDMPPANSPEAKGDQSK
jgi:hypothetical protein